MIVGGSPELPHVMKLSQTKKVLVTAIVSVCLVTFLLQPVEAQAPTETIAATTTEQVEPVEKKPETYHDIVIRLAKKHKVSSEKMWNTLKCENTQLDPKLQSGIKYTYSDARRGIVEGQYEKSFGLVQIHLPDHPEISHAQATNPEFAIEYMASEFSKGNADAWSCYRKLY